MPAEPPFGFGHRARESGHRQHGGEHLPTLGQRGKRSGMSRVPSPWLGELRPQAALFVRAARTSFAYKPAMLLGMLTVGVGYAVPMLVWRHIYSQPNVRLAVPASQLFPYLLLAASLNFCFFLGVESRIGQRIRLGLIATDLLRPVDFQLTQLTQALADVLLNGVMVLPFVGLSYVLWGRAALPPPPLGVAGCLRGAF